MTRKSGRRFLIQADSARPRVNPDPKSASDVQLDLPGGQFGKPTPFTGDEIEDLISAFASTARNFADAGFHGVQVHGAHGYLINQFLSPLANLREDEWGGSLENRARLLRRIVQKIKSEAPEGFAVSVKLNSSDFQKGGFGPEDARQVSRWLAEDGVDLIEISGGTYEQPKMLEFEGAEKPEEIQVRESTRKREAFFQQFAAEMRADVQVSLMVTGGFRNAAGMAEAINEDGIALIGAGRPLCGAPDCVNDLMEGRAELPRFEKKLGQGNGLFSPNSKVGMFRLVATFSVMAWYYDQILAMGEGRSPRLGRNSLAAFMALQWREIKWVRKRKKLLKTR